MLKKLLVSLTCLVCLTVTAIAAAPVYQNYQDNTNRFMIDLPEGFTNRPAPRAEIKLASVKPEGRVCIQVASQPVNGIVTQQNRALTISTWANRCIALLRQDPTNTHIDTEITNIGGHEAGYVKYICHVKMGDKVIPLYIEKYLIEANDLFYQITTSCDTAVMNQYKPVFDHSVNSFFTY